MTLVRLAGEDHALELGVGQQTLGHNLLRQHRTVGRHGVRHRRHGARLHQRRRVLDRARHVDVRRPPSCVGSGGLRGPGGTGAGWHRLVRELGDRAPVVWRRLRPMRGGAGAPGARGPGRGRPAEEVRARRGLDGTPRRHGAGDRLQQTRQRPRSLPAARRHPSRRAALCSTPPGRNPPQRYRTDRSCGRSATICVCRAATINETRALAIPYRARNHAPAAGAGNLTLIDARLSSRSSRYRHHRRPTASPRLADAYRRVLGMAADDPPPNDPSRRRHLLASSHLPEAEQQGSPGGATLGSGPVDRAASNSPLRPVDIRQAHGPIAPSRRSPDLLGRDEESRNTDRRVA